VIARLRRGHRATFIALALALPILFAAAIFGRAPEAVLVAPPDALFDCDASVALSSEALRDARSGREFALDRTSDELSIVVSQTAGEPAPDVLAYACTTCSANSHYDDALPDDALLLGALHGGASRFQTPPGCTRVFLFSLARGEVVAAFDLGAR